MGGHFRIAPSGTAGFPPSSASFASFITPSCALTMILREGALRINRRQTMTLGPDPCLPRESQAGPRSPAFFDVA